MGHIQVITHRKKGIDYELEIDAEDPENLVLESVTQISGPKPEQDIDPDDFESDLDDDDWIEIDRKLKWIKP